MRYFRMFYKTEAGNSFMSELKPLHEQFDDQVYVLPYRRGGWESHEGGDFCASLIAKQGSMGLRDVQKYFEQAMGYWGFEDAEELKLEECTVEECFMDCTRHFNECCFDERNVKKQLNLDRTFSFIYRNGSGLNECIKGKQLDEATARELASKTDYQNDLHLELDRIFASSERAAESSDSPSSAEEGASHGDVAPISYIIEGNAQTDVDDALNVLLGALQAAGRLDSRHVFSLDLDSYLRWPTHDSDGDRTLYLSHQLIRVIEGNTLVIRYGAFESSDSFDLTVYNLFTRLLDLIESAQCFTQIIFSIPEGKKDLVMRLRKRYNKPLVLVSKNVGTDLSQASFEQNLERMKTIAEGHGMTIDDSMRTLLSKRMRSNRETELEDVFREWALYRDARLRFPQYSNVIEDAINLDGDDSQTSAQERLEGLIGLESVKEHINNMILRVEMGKHLLERGLPREPFSMHMAFVGAPGTGKTEVARLFAEILKDKGILSEGRLVSVSGSQAFSVSKAFEAAKGSVLFIDEAYGLLSPGGMVTDLIAEMENNRTDTVVILAGYRGHMNALLDSNPGFRSRVQTVIDFPDYTADELRQIFMYMCERQQVKLGEGVEEAMRDTFERGGKRLDQGNARFVRKLFDDAVGAQQVRLAKHLKEGKGVEITLEELQELTLQDVECAVKSMGMMRKAHDRTGREELESLIGLDKVKEIVAGRMDFAKMQKVKRDAGLKAPFIPMHMAFKGNPGTGKTEVARLIGRILHEEGVLSVGDFYECGRQDLVSPIVGGSAPMIEQLFRKARGSVIFIDEAYSLIDGAKGGPGDEAINALIDQMEKLREEVVVILAGYTHEIDDLLSLNPGFKSRVKMHIEFPNYAPDELVRILHHMAQKQELTLAEGVDERVHAIVTKASRLSEFGNARFVRNLLEDALVSQSVRLAAKKELPDVDELVTLLPEDFAWDEPESAGRVIGFAA